MDDFAEFLTLEGYAVHTVEDGEKAIAELRLRPYDLVISDLKMPRISGLDLIQRVRASSGPQAEMPMIALTAYVMREQRAAIESAGADGIIAKPILSIEKFGDDIVAFMRQRQGRRQGPAELAGPTADAEAVGADMNAKVFNTLWSSFDAEGRIELKARVSQDIRSSESGS